MRDEFGLNYNASDERLPALFCDAIEAYLASSIDTMPLIDQMLELDPNMPMALLFRAYLLKLSADPRFRPAIAHCYQQIASQTVLNDREKQHLHALSYWMEDKLEETVSIFDNIVNDYPADMLALRVAHYLHFYGSGAASMQRSLAPALQVSQPQDRYAGYLSGMQSFACEEAGDYDAAELTGRQALARNPADIWAAHAVTHICQMQGRFEAGLTLIGELEPYWGNINNFANHLYWHEALLHLGLGAPEQALAIYDQQLVAPLADDFYLDMCNAASLLWRLEMAGVDPGQRWEHLLTLSRARITDDELVFSSLHYLMAPARLADPAPLQAAIQHFEQWAEAPTSQGVVAREVGRSLARGLCQLGSHEAHAGAAEINSVTEKLELIGGSHAQRQLFSQLVEHHRMH